MFATAKKNGEQIPFSHGTALIEVFRQQRRTRTTTKKLAKTEGELDKVLDGKWFAECIKKRKKNNGPIFQLRLVAFFSLLLLHDYGAITEICEKKVHLFDAIIIAE